MKKLISVFLIAIIVLTLSLSAFAATVSSSIYGDETRASKSLTGDQVSGILDKAGVTDVDTSSWYAGSLAELVSQGLLTPDSNGQIYPSKPVETLTTVTVVAKLLGVADKNDTPEQATAKAKAAGLTSSSAPAELTRLDVAKLLAKALNITPKAGANSFKDTGSLSAGDQAILAALYDAHVFVGYGDGAFHPDDKLTTAQLAVLIDRLLGTKK